MTNCFLTEPFGDEVCDFNVAGVSELYLIGHEKVSGYTMDADKESVTGLTLQGGSKFNKVTYVKDTTGLEDVFTVGGSNRFMTQTLKFSVGSYGPGSTRKAHQILLGKHVALVKRKNGMWQIVGLLNGLEATEGTSNTGVAATDEAGRTFTIVTQNLGYAPFIAESLIKPLLSTAVSL